MDPKTKQLVEEVEALVGSIHGPFLRDSIEEADVEFLENAPVKMIELCSAVREQDKRTRHAEEERDAFDKRIAELEAQVQKQAIQIQIRDLIIERGNALMQAVRKLGSRVTGEEVSDAILAFGAAQAKGFEFFLTQPETVRYEPTAQVSSKQTPKSP